MHNVYASHVKLKFCSSKGLCCALYKRNSIGTHKSNDLSFRKITTENANISSVQYQLQHSFSEEEIVAQSDRAMEVTN